MLSRVANSIYWMSRYLERADNVARFIRVNTNLMLDLGLDKESTQWYPLIAASGDDEEFKKRYEVADERSVLKFLTFDEKNPNSIIASIFRARENARTVREVIPVSMWEMINDLYHLTLAQSRKTAIANLHDYYDEIRRYGYVLSGLKTNTMLRDQSWQFAHIGQMLERADKTARLIDVKYFLLLPDGQSVDGSYDAVQWGAVLKSVDALEMYRQQYHAINYRDVTKFLMLSPLFPRSVAFTLHAARDALATIDQELGTTTGAESEVSNLAAKIDAWSAREILASGLHEFIDVLQQDLNFADQAIFDSYFWIPDKEAAE